MGVSLSALSELTGTILHGDGDCVIERVSEISAAEPGCIAFISNPKYVGHLKHTRASAVILQQTLVEVCPVAALVADDPRCVYAKVANILHPPRERVPGISPQALIDPAASIDKEASIAPGAVIQQGATIMKKAYIGPGCVIEENAVVGVNSVLNANITLGYDCTIGNDCIIHAGVVIGADGFGFVRDGDTYIKIPQLGCVRIADNVEIGANSTIDRGALEDTLIGNGVKMDNQVQIAHGVTIGNDTVISAATAIAGSTHIGCHCLIGGLVGIVEHLSITDNVMITGRTMVTRSITKAGSYSSSTPMDTTENWRKNSARFRRLDELARRVASLEKLINNKSG